MARIQKSHVDFLLEQPYQVRHSRCGRRGLCPNLQYMLSLWCERGDRIADRLQNLQPKCIFKQPAPDPTIGTRWHRWLDEDSQHAV
jgi:hypothetical protein